MRYVTFFLIILLFAFNCLGKQINLEDLNRKISFVVNNSKNDACSTINKFEYTDITEIDIIFENNEKWFSNFSKALKSKKNSIASKYKKKFNAFLNVKYNGKYFCKYKANIRISGDHKDHLSYDWFSSLDVSLVDGNINNITKFKLFLPETRNSDNELFSTLFFNELGFFAPSTSFVDVNINSNSKKYIFQEKIVKEFLERNNLREGPIVEFDERFMFGDKVNLNQRTDYLGFYRISNESWVSKSINNYIISKNILNFINNNLINYHTQKEKSFNEFNIFFNQENIYATDLSSIYEYNTLLWALNGQHGLRPSNRKYYFDNLNNKFYPIYYDGDTKILSLDIKNFNHSNTIPSYLSKYSDKLIKKINLIKRKDFLNKLHNHNILLNEGNLEIIFKNILNNLEKIKNINYQSSFEFNEDYKLKINSFTHQKRLKNLKFVFSDIESEKLYYCNYKLNDCDNLYLNFEKKVNLINQKLKIKDSEYIYIGDYKKIKNPRAKSNREFVSIDKLKKIDFTNFYLLFDDNSTNVKIDNKNKEINISQINLNPRVIFKGKILDGWNINYEGNLNYLDFKSRSDIFSLTGCITFSNIKLKNLNIKTANSVCEDAINFLHVEGENIKIKSNNSFFDTIDADFSKIKFSEILVNKSRNDCLDLSWGEYYLQSFKSSNCGDKAISIGEKSIVLGDKIEIENSNIGLANKDSSFAYFEHIKLNILKTCLSAYNKKKEFSDSFMFIKNITCTNYLFLKDYDNQYSIEIANDYSKNALDKNKYIFKKNYEHDLIRDTNIISEKKYLNYINEIEKSSNIKWEISKKSGNFEQDFINGSPRFIKYSNYQFNYGFIPQTVFALKHGGDNDPIDAILLGDKVSLGQIIETIPIGIIKMRDMGEYDHKIVLVEADTNNKQFSIEELNDIYQNEILDSINWLKNYKGNNIVEFISYDEHDEAKRIINIGNKYFNKFGIKIR